MPPGTEAWSQILAPPHTAIIGLRSLIFTIWKNEDNHTDGTQLLEGLTRDNAGKGRSTVPSVE